MSMDARARLLLHRQLTELRQFAVHRNEALLSAFDSGQAEGVPSLAHGVFEKLKETDLSGLSISDENEMLSDSTLQALSRCLAVAVHTYALAKYHNGRLEPIEEEPAHILRAIGRAERHYRGLLLDTRIAARNSMITHLRKVLIDGLDVVMGDIAYIAQTLGGQQDIVKSNKLAAVRAGVIARRYAMLSAACLQLMFRLTNNRKAAGLRQVAERRGQLMPLDKDMLAAITVVSNATPGSRLRLSARCESVSWVDVDDGYTAIFVAAGQVTELRLARRNAMRAGVAEGSRLYAEGMLKDDEGRIFLDIERLSTSTSAVDVWEDYLVTEVRSVYDLYPGSIDMSWEFPDLRRAGARNDLHGRL